MTTKEYKEVLIVEDSPTQALHLQHDLEKNGFLALVAANGQEGLELVRKRKPFLVITDIMMPVMNGYELCRRIKDDPELKDIPVMLLTTLSNPTDVFEGLKCGADNFMNKPYDLETLMSRIHYVAANKELRRQTSSTMAIELQFGGQRHVLTSERIQILDMLLSAFETAVQKNAALEAANHKLQEAAETIGQLRQLIPICAKCKRIRNDKGFWQQLEVYFSEKSIADFTHGLCAECARQLCFEANVPYKEHPSDKADGSSK